MTARRIESDTPPTIFQRFPIRQACVYPWSPPVKIARHEHMAKRNRSYSELRFHLKITRRNTRETFLPASEKRFEQKAVCFRASCGCCFGFESSFFFSGAACAPKDDRTPSLWPSVHHPRWSGRKFILAQLWVWCVTSLELSQMGSLTSFALILFYVHLSGQCTVFRQTKVHSGRGTMQEQKKASDNMFLWQQHSLNFRLFRKRATQGGVVLCFLPQF